MTTPLYRLLRSLALSFACLVGGISSTTSPAWADRPWQNTPQKARILSDRPLSGPLMPLLTALPDGTLYGLDPKGVPQRIDPVSGTLYPLTGLPSLMTLNATNQGIWGVTRGPKTALLVFSADGHILNHITLGKAALSHSRFSTLQVGEHHAYLADDGAPALVLVDLKTGSTQRLLESVPSLSAHRPLRRGGNVVTRADGQPRSGGNVRFLILDHTGQWLFYQARSGPLYRLGTALLTDPSMSPAQQIEGMAMWRDTPSLGGLGRTHNDSLYMVDIDHGDILKFGTDRLPWSLLHDERLYNAQDLALLTPDVHGSVHMAVLLGDGTKPGHLVIYDLP